jgi:hypothetical protein
VRSLRGRFPRPSPSSLALLFVGSPRWPNGAGPVYQGLPGDAGNHVHAGVLNAHPMGRKPAFGAGSWRTPAYGVHRPVRFPKSLLIEKSLGAGWRKHLPVFCRGTRSPDRSASNNGVRGNSRSRAATLEVEL